MYYFQIHWSQFDIGLIFAHLRKLTFTLEVFFSKERNLQVHANELGLFGMHVTSVPTHGHLMNQPHILSQICSFYNTPPTVGLSHSMLRLDATRKKVA